MKFGKVEDPSLVDFTLPQDNPDTKNILSQHKKGLHDIYVGCAKWNKTDLKGFYPKGTKDELSYYASQFNSVELNATFYKYPTAEQVADWKTTVPEGFKFCPKLTNGITHFRRLKDVDDAVTKFTTEVIKLTSKLGMVLMQMHDNFKPKDFDRLEKFVSNWPQELPLAIELRNEEWFADAQIFDKTMQLFEDYHITNIIVDTAGRRDMLHMRLTTPKAFIRYVGANAPSDYDRLDEWLERLTIWREAGLQELYFFVHQNIEKASPLLSAHLITQMNARWGSNLHVPVMADAKEKF